ncbi:MAG: histidine kinase [Gemmatimonadaceae bacterium]
MESGKVVAKSATAKRHTFDVKKFLALQLVVWTTYGVVHYAASIPAILPEERQVIAIAKAVRAITGFGVSSLLVPVLQWRRFSHRATLGFIAGLGAVIAAFAWMFLDRVVLVITASAFQLSIPWDRFPRGMDLDYLFVMLAWTGAYVGLMLFERSSAQREELLKQQVDMQSARLSLLAAQLNPHFLFNSLNTIRSLAAEDATRTREVVSRLSSFLRRVISFDATIPVHLGQEIELARDYLGVEQARFESAMDVAFEIDPSSADILVPPLILQPLLENAVKHGEPDCTGIRRILVTASMKEEELRLRIENSGSLIGASRYDGVGLKLTESRLAHLYGDAHAFHLSEGDRVVIAEVTINAPLRRASDGEQS